MGFPHLCYSLPSGNQTRQWNIHYKWTFSGHFEGPQALILTWFEGCLGLFWSWGLPLSKKFVEPLRWGSQVLYRCMIRVWLRLTSHELPWLWMYTALFPGVNIIWVSITLFVRLSMISIVFWSSLKAQEDDPWPHSPPGIVEPHLGVGHPRHLMWGHCWGWPWMAGILWLMVVWWVVEAVFVDPITFRDYSSKLKLPG